MEHNTTKQTRPHAVIPTVIADGAEMSRESQVKDEGGEGGGRKYLRKHHSKRGNISAVRV